MEKPYSKEVVEGIRRQVMASMKGEDFNSVNLAYAIRLAILLGIEKVYDSKNDAFQSYETKETIKKLRR